MTWQETLVSVMKKLGIPCEEIIYGGEEQVYSTFNNSVIPTNYADDEPQHERVLIQLHLFAPKVMDTRILRRQIKLSVHEAGFTYPSQVDAGDDDEQHITFEFETVEGTGL